MGEDVRVREPASVAEYRAGLEVIAEAWRAAFDDIVSATALAEMDEFASGSKVAEQYDRSRAATGSQVMVALAEQTVVGSGSVVWDPAKTKDFVGGEDAELRTLYVAPKAWGEGIGSALLARLTEAAPADCEQLVLETFRENELGRSFYEARGFSPVGSTSFSIGGEAYPTVIYARSHRK